MTGREWVIVAALVVLVVASIIFLVYANTGGRYLKS